MPSRISLVSTFCTRANWQQGARTHTICCCTHFSVHARTLLLVYMYTHTHTQAHNQAHCAVYSGNSAAANIRLDASWHLLQRASTVQRLSDVFCVCVVCVWCVRASYAWRVIHTHTHRQQFWIVYVRARHEQKQNAKATQGWRAVTTRRARWVRVVVVVVQKGRVSCWGLKRAQYSSTLFRVYRVCILCTCKQTDMHTHTHTHMCVHI